jgi:hypothetical protein
MLLTYRLSGTTRFMSAISCGRTRRMVHIAARPRELCQRKPRSYCRHAVFRNIGGNWGWWEGGGKDFFVIATPSLLRLCLCSIPGGGEGGKGGGGAFPTSLLTYRGASLRAGKRAAPARYGPNLRNSRWGQSGSKQVRTWCGVQQPGVQVTCMRVCGSSELYAGLVCLKPIGYLHFDQGNR